MTSSAMAGERRWGSARRGGMTVLGKVAVPKPLNLPSQRLENHGLDPSVEIVPKGTLNWGSRSSSSATNAWGSSSLSPSADGSANSPSHLSGRPSSGGSGTRPSTSGSDRQIEPTGKAWGPNSRPSSASGALASNQSSLTSLRPRSAETRPGSSHLSRFAESVSDSPGAWGASGTTDRLGVVSSKKDEFSLSTGDFPTLGSDKDHPGKSMESKDPGSQSRPSSASGRLPPTKDKTETSHAEDASGAYNSWKKDGSQNVGDGVQPSMENWQGDSQQYFNHNVPPQHFDAWRGPPVNAPPGIWYRGPPGGPPYGAPVGPGGFPIEPFPYFPQIPPPAFANSQPVPPPRAGPREHRPRSGNAYRPQIPDGYVRPGMPFRPGFYPPMAFEGYYGPPMGYYNSNERDVPFMGVGAGHSVYDRCLPPNAPDLGDSHARAGGVTPSGKAMSDDKESVCSRDARGPYKILVNHHNEWEGKEHGGNCARMPPESASHPPKGEKGVVAPRKYEWGAEDDGEEDIYSSNYFDNRSGYSESVTSSCSQLPQVSIASVRDSAFPSSIKGATLMQKIEGLNAKVRIADGRVDNASSGEEKMFGPNTVSTKADTFTNKAGKSDVLLERTSPSGYFSPTSHGMVVSAGDKISQPTAAILRRPSHGTSSENNHHGKGKFSKQDPDGWQRKPVSGEFPSVVSSSKVEPASNFEEPDAHPAMGAAMINPLAKDEGDSAAEMHDSTDSQAQRAKKSELAKQRALQLQKEEEERTREQKAKALAKLEELNRRSQSGDASNKTTKKPLASGTFKKEQEGWDIETRECAPKLETSKLEELNGRMQSGDASNQAADKPLASGTSKKVQEGKDIETRESASQLEASKLEELNRHMQSGDTSNQAVKKPSASGTSKKVQEGRDREPRESASKLEASALVSPLKTEVVSLSKENSGIQVAGSDIPSQALQTMMVESVSCDVSVPLKQNAVNAHVADGKYSGQLIEGGGSKFKRTSYKQKQKTVMLKNLTEKSNPVDGSEVQKSPVGISVLDAASVVAASEVSSSNQPYLPNNSSTVFESSAPQRRRSNKSTKNKNKQEDAPSIPALTLDVLYEAIPPEDADKDVKSQLPSLELNTGPTQAAINGESGVELSQQHSSLTSEEAHGKVSPWKPQQSRRMPKNQQASRFVDKFHGNDAFIWTPVRSQNKAENTTEATVEGYQKPIALSVNPDKCDNLVQNSSKSKRAEMERYVPKPVAKELAQQVGMQKPESSLAHKSTPDETTSQQTISSATGKVGSPVQSVEGVAKHNKQGKVHGAWRQRGYTECSDAKNVQQGSSFSSNPSKNPQEAILRIHPSNLEANSAQPKTKTSSKLNASDSRVKFSNSDASPPDTSPPDASPFSKNEGVAGKGNRHPYRGHRNLGNSLNNANKHNSSAETDKTQIQSPFSDYNQSDRGIASKETHSIREHMSSHWEPKSHANSVSGLKGSRVTGRETVNAEASRVTKEDYPRQQRVNTPPQHDERSNYIDKTPLDQLVSDNKVGADVLKAGNYEPSRERKITSYKGRPYSPNQNFATDESGPAFSSNTQQERPFSAGSRRHGNQFSRSGRGHEYRGDLSGQDSGQHNMPTNRDRQKHNMHYEYQPVGSYNNHNTRSKNLEGLADGSRNAGPRFKDRGPSYPKRGGGNFYGQQNASLHADAGWE